MATTFTVQCFKSGVVAFSQEIDVETDTYEEPRVLCRIGTLPTGLFADV